MPVEDIGFVAAVECPNCGWSSCATELESDTPIQDVAFDASMHEEHCDVTLGHKNITIKLTDMEEN